MRAHPGSRGETGRFRGGEATCCRPVNLPRRTRQLVPIARPGKLRRSASAQGFAAGRARDVDNWRRAERASLASRWRGARVVGASAVDVDLGEKSWYVKLQVNIAVMVIAVPCRRGRRVGPYAVDYGRARTDKTRGRESLVPGPPRSSADSRLRRTWRHRPVKPASEPPWRQAQTPPSAG